MHAAKKKAKMIQLGILNPDGTKKTPSQAIASSSEEFTKPKSTSNPQRSTSGKTTSTSESPSVSSDASSLSGSFKLASTSSLPVDEDLSTSGSRCGTSSPTGRKKKPSLLTEDFSSVFDINKDEIARAKACHDVRLTIDKLMVRSDETKAQMEQDLTKAEARGGGGWAGMGVILSMRRYKRCELEVDHLQHQIKQLNELNVSIQKGEVKIEGYKEKAEAILQQVLSDDNPFPSDDELLAELQALQKRQ